MNQLRVLVIELEPAKQQRLGAILRDAHYEVLYAPSFSEATEALVVQRFDAILVGSPGDSKAQAEFTNGLRRIERSRGLGVKTPVLLCSEKIPSGVWKPTQEEWADAYLSEHFGAATFTDAVLKLASALTPAKPIEMTGNSDLPIFEPDKFQAQVAYDNDLLVEIIDLFLGESPTQVSDMKTALSAGDFSRLGRVAHTLKGSLGSLHASLARSQAQHLESAAKTADGQLCTSFLALLEQNLAQLTPQLISLRSSVVGQ